MYMYQTLDFKFHSHYFIVHHRWLCLKLWWLPAQWHRSERTRNQILLSLILSVKPQTC